MVHDCGDSSCPDLVLREMMEEAMAKRTKMDPWAPDKAIQSILQKVIDDAFPDSGARVVFTLVYPCGYCGSRDHTAIAHEGG